MLPCYSDSPDCVPNYYVFLIYKRKNILTPILKWQYDQIVKELMLLQEHEFENCPCETSAEMCKRKHLMTIEAYTEETMAMESEIDRKDKLHGLCREAKDHRSR